MLFSLMSNEATLPNIRFYYRFSLRRFEVEQSDWKEGLSDFVDRLLGRRDVLRDQHPCRGIRQSHTGGRMHGETGAANMVGYKALQMAKGMAKAEPSIWEVARLYIW